MKSLSYKRITESQEFLSPLGNVRHRALFGGYSLSVDDTVFAMVVEGELYLRACEQNTVYEVNAPRRLLTMNKRGRPVSLNYFLVDETLWHDPPLLLQMSAHSLNEARYEKLRQCKTNQLRRLPNISFQLELLLMEVGVNDPESLRELGATTVWQRIRAVRKNLSVNVLYALEGAILGVHATIIPAERRQFLKEWAEKLAKGV